MSKISPLFVLSGLCGVGKSCLMEHTRILSGALTMRSYSKYILSKFQKGTETDSLIQDSMMNAYHCSDLLRDELIPRPLLVERSIIDSCYFHNYFRKDKLTLDDIREDIKLYFSLISRDVKPIYIVDIRMYDESAVNRSVKESEYRGLLIKNFQDYCEHQVRFKDYTFDTLDKVGIKYEKIDLNIDNLDACKSEVRESWIRENLMSRF